MKYNPKQNKKLLLEALERSLGIVTTACKEVGISRNQFYIYMNTDEEFKKAVNEQEEIRLDFVEHQLLKKIKDGNERSILFYLKYRGKNRGYTDSIDITSNGKDIINDIQITIVPPKQDENT